MNAKEFRKYLDRDKGCLHCGETEAVAPNHRINRQMGGSKARDVPSNIVVLCSAMNNAIESDAQQAKLAKWYGWKLNTWDNPGTKPVYDTQTSLWYVLGDDFSRNMINNGKGTHEH